MTTSWGNCEQFIQASDPSFLGEENQIFSRMALQGQTMIAASGDAGSEDCFPNQGASRALAVDDPGSQPNVVSAGGTTLSSASAGSQVVWNDCQGQTILCAEGVDSPVPNPGAGGGGDSVVWSRPSYQDGAETGSGARAVPDIAYPSDPTAGSVVAYFDGGWTGFGGTSVGAPSNAGLFADTNQGCFAQLGMANPALYAAAGGANYTDITAGNNDFTDTNGGQYPARSGYDQASGLGTPVDPNLAIALQGGDGCPSVAAVSPNTGPVVGSGPITVYGGGFADASSVTFGAVGAGPDPRAVRDEHHGGPAQRAGAAVRRRHRQQPTGRLGRVAGRRVRLRRRPELRPGLPLRGLRRRVSSTTATPGSSAPPAA